jgi:hypothetical protein
VKYISVDKLEALVKKWDDIIIEWESKEVINPRLDAMLGATKACRDVLRSLIADNAPVPSRELRDRIGVEIAQLRYDEQASKTTGKPIDLPSDTWAYRIFALISSVPQDGHSPTCSQITGGFDCDCGYEPSKSPPPASPAVKRNDIVRRFNGPEGDIAAASLKLYVCNGCGKKLRGEQLVIDPGNNYFYHEKTSGEICGRYELVLGASQLSVTRSTVQGTQ